MSKAAGGSCPIESITDRFRSWFLLNVDKPGDVAGELLQYADKAEWDLVLIRADVVHLSDESTCSINLIVPVDAGNEDDLTNFKDYLLAKGFSVIEARVKNHFPIAPYLSNGYISKEEAILGLWEDVLPESLGLTRTSPGDNPWG